MIGAPVLARVPVDASEDGSAEESDGVLVSVLVLVPGDGVGMAPSGVAVGVGDGLGDGDDLGEGDDEGVGDGLGDGVGLVDGDGFAADPVL